MTNRSTLFQVYNAGRRMGIEPGRLNRALGLCQRRSRPSEYATTAYGCTCADHKYRRVTCKHMLALAMLAACEVL